MSENIRIHRAGRIDGSIERVMLVDIDNVGYNAWKGYLCKGRHLIVFTAHRNNGSDKAILKIVNWCRERGHIVAGYSSRLAQPDLTDHMLAAAALEWLNNYPMLKNLEWSLCTNDKGLKSSVVVLQHYLTKRLGILDSFSILY